MLTTGALRSRKLARISLAAEAVYWRVYMASDNYGTMLGDPWDVQHDALPGKVGAGEATIAKALDELVSVGLLERWHDDDTTKVWIHVSGHDRHQQSAFLARRGPRRSPMPPTLAAHFGEGAPLDPDPLASASPPDNQRPDAVVVRTHADARTITSTSTSIEEPSLFPSPSPPPPSSSPSTGAVKIGIDQVRRVFDYWAKVEAQTGGVGSAASANAPIMSSDREKVIRARLAEGYAAEQLMKAIAFYARDPWHLGGNDRRKRFTGLATTLKSGTKIEEGAAGYDQRHDGGAEMAVGSGRTSKDDAAAEVWA